MSRAGEVWELSWPGGGGVLVLLEGAQNRDFDGKRMVRCFTLCSDDPSIPEGEVDGWADSWFGKPEGLVKGCTSRRIA